MELSGGGSEPPDYHLSSNRYVFRAWLVLPFNRPINTDDARPSFGRPELSESLAALAEKMPSESPSIVLPDSKKTVIAYILVVNADIATFDYERTTDGWEATSVFLFFFPLKFAGNVLTTQTIVQNPSQ